MPLTNTHFSFSTTYVVKAIFVLTLLTTAMVYLLYS